MRAISPLRLKAQSVLQVAHSFCMQLVTVKPLRAPGKREVLSGALLDNDSRVDLHQAGWLLGMRAQKERAVSCAGKSKILLHSAGGLGACEVHPRKDSRV